MNATPLFRTQTAQSLYRNLNCWTAGITKKHRKLYKQSYPTYLILPDGSSINIDYDTPRKIIMLPMNINTLSEEERQKRILARTPLSKVKIVQETDIDFDETEFFKMRN